jgi:hypothetical protein
VTAGTEANGSCRACLVPVIWARTERARWLALNPKPDPGGNQAAWKDSDGTWKTRQLSEASEPQWDFEGLFRPHVATCEKRKPPPEPAPLPPNVIPFKRPADRGVAAKGARRG